jgi:DNA-directed RNA polymerase II subunit RPB1
MKRHLTSEEIDDLCSVITHSNNNINFEADNVYIDNVRSNLKKQLVLVQIIPDVIPKLKTEIARQYARSIVQPGEMVGGVAAGSMGQVNTQDSLNSFHAAGQLKANLTTGLTRLTELMNLSETLKTPSLTIYFKREVGKSLESVRALAYSKLIYKTIGSILQDWKIEQSPTITKEDKAWYDFHSLFIDDEWRECTWRMRLKLDVKALFLSKKNLQHIVECINGHIDTKMLKFVWSYEHIGIIDIWIEDPTIEDNKLDPIKRLINTTNIGQHFLRNIVLTNLLTVPFTGIVGLEECYYQDQIITPTGLGADAIKDETEWFIETKGGDLRKLFVVDEVDGTRCKSNNAWDIYKLFGVEAAKAFLREEFKKNINVSFRHLDLLVECMTHSGTLSSVNRYGIDRTQVGPIAKASFEQPVENFLISATKAEIDDLRGVSASVTCGRLGGLGTGMMELILDTSKLIPQPIVHSFDYRDPVKQEQEEEIL